MDGFFGGSFDPIHFGHLNLAIEIKEALDLETVYFCPTNQNPKKMELAPFFSAKDRLEMLSLAIEDIPYFKILDTEIFKEDPSYTADTLKNFNHPNLRLILGADTALNFSTWKNPELIKKLAPPVIGCRGEVYLDSSIAEFEKVSTAILDISSTNIRNRLQKKLYIGHLVPAKVLDYIHKRGLY